MSVGEFKGTVRGGRCARTVCAGVGAEWFNNSTRRWYCTPCAHAINEAAGELICVHVPPEMELKWEEPPPRP